MEIQDLQGARGHHTLCSCFGCHCCRPSEVAPLNEDDQPKNNVVVETQPLALAKNIERVFHTELDGCNLPKRALIVDVEQPDTIVNDIKYMLTALGIHFDDKVCLDIFLILSNINRMVGSSVKYITYTIADEPERLLVYYGPVDAINAPHVNLNFWESLSGTRFLHRFPQEEAPASARKEQPNDVEFYTYELKLQPILSIGKHG